MKQSSPNIHKPTMLLTIIIFSGCANSCHPEKRAQHDENSIESAAMLATSECEELGSRFSEILAEVLTKPVLDQLSETLLIEFLESSEIQDLGPEAPSLELIREEIEREAICITIGPIWEFNVGFYRHLIDSLPLGKRTETENVIFRHYLEFTIRDEMNDPATLSTVQNEANRKIGDASLRIKLSAVLDDNELRDFDEYADGYARRTEKVNLDSLLDSFDVNDVLSNRSQTAIVEILGEHTAQVWIEYFQTKPEERQDMKYLADALIDARATALKLLVNELAEEEYLIAQELVKVLDQSLLE